ncbi:MAG: hypothetical protein F6J87_01810 [Spirulina sp. SIO3F2]|nr:hypothetical protein [Spirulina sp. SIO3F2]
MFSVSYLAILYLPFFLNPQKLVNLSLETPEAAKNFPSHKSSHSDYLEVKARIQDFLKGTENGHAEVILSSNDLNVLNEERGSNKIVKKSDSFKILEYYKISEDFIYNRCLIYPAINAAGYSEYTELIKFESKNNTIKEIRKTIVSKPPSIQYIFQKITGIFYKSPLIRSSIVYLALRTVSSDCGYSVDDIDNLISKVKSIEIRNSELIIKS